MARLGRRLPGIDDVHQGSASSGSMDCEGGQIGDEP
jgi:hypothetical protein